MKPGRIFKRIIITVAAICLVVGGSIYSCILYNALTAHPEKSDVIIVLGARINGMSPSLCLKYRLEKALEVYNKGFAGNVIVSGGKGANEATYEAEVMKNWLVARGIDSSRIYTETRSTSTYENLKFSKEIADKQGFKSAIIVSNDFHIFRSLSIAHKVGLSTSAAPAPTEWYHVPYYNAREVLSIIKNFLLNRM